MPGSPADPNPSSVHNSQPSPGGPAPCAQTDGRSTRHTTPRYTIEGCLLAHGGEEAAGYITRQGSGLARSRRHTLYWGWYCTPKSLETLTCKRRQCFHLESPAMQCGCAGRGANSICLPGLTDAGSKKIRNLGGCGCCPGANYIIRSAVKFNHRRRRRPGKTRKRWRHERRIVALRKPSQRIRMSQSAQYGSAASQPRLPILPRFVKIAEDIVLLESQLTEV